MENEQADAGRDGRTRLARPNSRAQTGTREIFLFLAQLTTSRIGNLTRLMYTLLHVMNIYAYCTGRKLEKKKIYIYIYLTSSNPSGID